MDPPAARKGGVVIVATPPPPPGLRAELVADGYRYTGARRAGGFLAYTSTAPDKRRGRIAVRFGPELETLLAANLLRTSLSERRALERKMSRKGRRVRITRVEAWHRYLVLAVRKVTS
jgi:hypothetical protein